MGTWRTQFHKASGTLLQRTLPSLAARGTTIEGKNRRHQKDKNEHQLLLQSNNGKIRSNEEPNSPRAEDVYCKGATQTRPSPHAQSHQAQSIPKHANVRKIMSWKKEEIRKYGDKEKIT
jgi:hypothetical protein